jgi:hypothetical protein
MENLLFLLFAVSFLFLMAVHVYQTNAFFAQLKSAHQELWTKMGEPKWQIHFGDDSFKNAMKYIRKKEFASLDDAVLNKCYTVMRRVELTAAAIAVLIFVMTIIDVLGEV